MNQTKLLFYKNTKLPLDLIKIISTRSGLAYGQSKYIKCFSCNNLVETSCIYCNECNFL